ncbi:hypothetical protein BD847_1965 [Flavobacterium cutihirudinis]|uniref:CHAT domain-containing protein n=1 Tax=Flavobacterium cutihirudinis TaxID=1265740 RepID=A0A3D9FWU8_9FLAO|nr:hypothetical protein [Flavobacterium cutihirudinis]RED25220.1 hypothetical protein BD847_1965 [Flavobacterium cutihirudinis]
MSKRTIHIIHPEDSSTDFLNLITEYIKEFSKINLIKLKTQEDHSIFFELIHTIDKNELILFFGHGTSTGLSGAVTKDYENHEFITEKQLKIFSEKNVMILSCRSNQYLKSYFKECNIQSAIGFPNLITDYEEIEHHDDPERLNDVSAKDIELFKEAIIDVMKFSLEDYVMGNLSIIQFYNRIKLRINKKIINLYNESPNKGKLPLGKMLNDMVDGMIFLNKNH